MKRKPKPIRKPRKQRMLKRCVSLPADLVAFCKARGGGKLSPNLVEIACANKEFRRWAETR